MKKKTLIIVIVIIVVIVLLIFAGIPLLNKAVYDRSLSATMFAWQLQKDAYTTEEDFNEYVSEKEEENAQAYVLPEDVTFSVSISEASYQDMQYYVMNAGSSDTVIVYFPGGSFIDQPRAVHWQFLDALCADTDAEVIVPIYPKLPSATATDAYALLLAFYEDVVAAQSYGDVVFMGDSAGGGMALSLAMQLRDESLTGPDRMILICPWVDVTMTNEEIPTYEKKDPALDSTMLAHLGELWAGDLSTTDPIVSPLYGNFAGLGDITIFTSTGELLYPDIMLLDSALTQAGIDHTTITSTGVFHVWPLYVHYNIKESSTTYAQIVDIVNEG